MIEYYDEIPIGTYPDGTPVYVHVEKITTTADIYLGDTLVTIHATHK